MTGFLPEIVLPLEASISDLIAKLTEANAAVHAWAEGLPDETRNLGPSLEKEGEKAGAHLRRGIEKGTRGDGRSVIGSIFGGIGSTFGAAGSVLFNKFSLIGGLVGGLAPLATTLAQTVGVLGLVPAAAMAAGESLAVLMIGFKGVGAAVGAGFSGDVKKYNEALAKLVPAQRAFVRELVATKPALTAIKQTVATNLFAGFAEQVRSLSGIYLPLLRTELGGVATGFNRAFREVLNLTRVPDYINSVRESLANMRAGIVNGSRAMVGFVSGFNDLINVGSRFLPRMGSWFAELGDRFSGFIGQVAGDGRLQQWIQTGIDALKIVGGVLRDLGSIVNSLLKAFTSAGGGATGVIGQLVHQLAVFFKTTQGAQALAGIFQLLGTVAGVFGQMLMLALPIVGQLLPMVNQLVAALMPLVSVLLGSLADVLGSVATALGPVMDALMPFVKLLADQVSQNLKAFAPILGQLAAVLGQVLVQALTALWPLFQQLLPVIGDLARAVLPALVPIIQLVGKLFTALMPALVPLVGLLADILVPVIKLLVPVLGLLTPILTVIADVLVWIITPIAQFIGWLAKGLDSAKTWTAIGHWFRDLWRGIVSGFNTALEWIKLVPSRIMAGLRAFPGILERAAQLALRRMAYAVGFGIGWVTKELMALPGQVWHLITSMWDGAIDLGVKGMTAVIHWIATMYWRTIAWFKKTKDDAIAHVTSMFVRVVQFFKDLPGKVWEFLKALPGKVNDAMKGAVTWLYEAGIHIVEGLLNGLKHKGADAVNWIKGLGHDLLKGFKDAVGISSPSRLFHQAGRFIVAGLVNGVKADAPQALAAIRGLIGAPGGLRLGLAGVPAGGGVRVPPMVRGPGPGGSQPQEYAPIVVNLGGKEMATLHAALIPTAQRYKTRAGTTGLS